MNVKQKEIQAQLQCALKKQQLRHAYLFLGEKGSGRFTTAQWLSGQFLYPKGVTKEEQERIEKGYHPDVHVLRPEGKVVKREEVQAFYEEMSRSGLESRRQVFIFLEADRFHEAASNLLLKMIEEPVGDCLFLFLAQRKEAILPTILSRVQVFYFSKVEIETEEEIYFPKEEREQKVILEEWIHLLQQKDTLAFPYVQMKIMPFVSARSKNLEQRKVQEQLLDRLLWLAKEAEFFAFFPLLFQAKEQLEQNVNFQHILEYIAVRMDN